MGLAPRHNNNVFMLVEAKGFAIEKTFVGGKEGRREGGREDRVHATACNFVVVKKLSFSRVRPLARMMATVRARATSLPAVPVTLVLLLLSLVAPSQQLDEDSYTSSSSSSQQLDEESYTSSATRRSSSSSSEASKTAAEREVAALLADSRPGALDLGRQRVEALTGFAQAAAGVGSSIAQGASHRAAARLKAAKLLKGRVVDDAATKAAAVIREQQRLAVESAHSVRFQRHVQDGLAEIVWVAAITATVGAALLTRRVMGWGEGRDGRSASLPSIRSSRVPTTPEEAAEEARLKEEIRRQSELFKRAVEADQNPTDQTDVAEMRRRGTGHRLGLVDQLVQLRGGVSSPEELVREQQWERQTEVRRRHERWRLGCEVAAAGCGATLGSLFSLGVSGVSGVNGGGGGDDRRLAGRRSLATIFGALVGTLAWLLVEPWAVSRFGLGPLGRAELEERVREWNQVPAAMQPRRHRAGGALQEEDKDTNIDVMLAATASGLSDASGGGYASKARRREGMPDWLKRKLLGEADPEPEPPPQVPGSVSAVRDRWTRQLREIEEMAAAGNPVPAPARPAWDPVGMADPEWDELVRGEAAASAAAQVRASEAGFSGSVRSDAGDRGARAGRRQQSNLYNVLLTQAETSRPSSDSWFTKTWK